jgi:hypothetical protein
MTVRSAHESGLGSEWEGPDGDGPSPPPCPYVRRTAAQSQEAPRGRHAPEALRYGMRAANRRVSGGDTRTRTQESGPLCRDNELVGVGSRTIFSRPQEVHLQRHSPSGILAASPFLESENETPCLLVQVEALSWESDG